MDNRVLFECKEINNCMYICFNRSITCTLWSKCWGIMSYSLRHSFKGNEVVCDLSSTIHADLFALMNIILDLYDVHLKFKTKISFVIPYLNYNSSNFYDPGVFLKHIASQGFLESIMKFATIKMGGSIINSGTIEKITGYNFPGIYTGDMLYPFTVFNVNSDNKDAVVNEVLKTIKPRLRNISSRYTSKHINEQVFNMISELVDNSYRHAYSNGEHNKLIAIYIRRRKGLSSISSLDTTKNTIDKEMNQEKVNLPATDNRIFSETSSFIEVFFTDLGIGLSESLKEYYAANFKEYKYPVQELYRKVLKDGIRREYSRSVTPFGGLHFICRILSESKGYIWCNEGKEWVGAFANELLSDSLTNNVSFSLTDNKENLYPLGLNWCFKIPVYKPIKEEYDFTEEWDDLPEEHPVYLALQNNHTRYSYKDVLVIDDSRNEIVYFIDSGKEYSLNNLNQLPELKNDINVLWIPNGTSTKNMLINKIGEICSLVSSRFKYSTSKINFLAGDINQDTLFGFFYAINNHSSNTVQFTRVFRIILVSKLWEIVVFPIIEQRFVLNKDLGAKYISNKLTGGDISYSLQNYCQFIRYYDSRCFWNIINKKKKEKYYINANIYWNGNQPIVGYLDLERVCLCPDLYKIIENALYRLAGIVYNNSVEFRAVDQTAKRICQGINSKRAIEDKNKTFIDVCGVSVTGYSLESPYSSDRSQIRISLFFHPDINKNPDNPTLFIWPDKSFFNGFKIEKDDYYRLGKTSLISKNANDRRIDSNKHFSNIVRSKKEMYEDFQQEVPQILRYGHYKTDNHHYLIGFDVISYMKYSFLKKKGAFVYILWKILYYLNGEDFINQLEGMVIPEWVDVLRNCQYKYDKMHGALVLYHSNTYTEYIMRKINSVISQPLQEKIIPLSIYEIQSKGNPLTFSPIMLDRIKSYFANNKSLSGVLYMDSSFSTGRRNVEIENILLSTNCNKVNFLSLIDMRRLRSNDPKSSSYWKVNIPRLDDDGHCIICDTLKELSNTRQFIASDYQQRIDEWNTNWTSMNINNAVPDHGIENEISSLFDIRGLNISNSIALNLYMAELLCESYNNESVYNYLQSKSELPVLICAQLLCTQLIMYGQQNSKQLQIDLLCKIVKLLSSSEETNSYTSLAGLVISMQDRSVVFDFLNTVLTKIDDERYKSVASSLLQSKNKDLQLAFAYHVVRNNNLERLINGNSMLNFKDSPFIISINEMILPKKDLKSIFKEFEGLYINECGENHSTSWNKLLKEKCASFSDYVIRCNRVKSETIRMINLVKEFPSIMKNSTDVSSFEISKLDELMREFEVEMRNNIIFAKENETLANSEGYFRTDSLANKMKEMTCCFDQVIKQYYISYSEASIKYFFDIIENYKSLLNKDIYLNVNNESTIKNKKRYFWHRGIEKEFKYLIDNVKHCNKCFIANDNTEHHMCVNISFDYDELLIEVTSLSTKFAEQVENIFADKNRLTKEQCYLFDVRFNFRSEPYDDSHFLLTVNMRIPACYPRMKGD